MSRKATQSPWRTPIARAHARWTEVDGDQCAAALAYYLLVSLLPLVIILVTAGSMFVNRDIATREVVQLVNRYTPLTYAQQRAAAAAIRGVLEARGTIGVAAFALLTFGALQFLRTLIRTTNHVWHSPAYNWWRLPLKSLGLLGITASVAVVGVSLPVVMRLVRPWLATNLALPAWAFALVSYLIPWLALLYGFVMMYKVAPSRATTFAEVWLGALTATVLIWIGEMLFLVYATHLAHFNALYGTLGGIVALLVWAYLASCVCVFGLCLCAAQTDVRPPLAR
jgi:YihY family inner membrane protein